MNPPGDIMIIESTYCGPSTSGQGGYVCGLLGTYIQGPADVTLRIPPPLDREMEVNIMGHDHVTLMDGNTLVAEARKIVLELDVPAPPAYADAQTASRDYIGFKVHPFPRCFVCGPERDTGDGLRIFPGPVQGERMVAAPWTPYAALSDGNGLVRREFMWAALDCPGAFAAMMEQPRVIVLGKLAVAIMKDIKADARFIAIGWKIAQEGRKHQTGTAVFSDSGELCAKAKATWIELK
jgi:hypothetical protein